MLNRIGALTISQSPRHDLIEPLHLAFTDIEIIEAGALDFADVSALPDGTDAYYPLTTRLTNGNVVTLDRDFLAPLVQTACNSLQQKGVDATILLCAGDFFNMTGDYLVEPTRTAQNILRAMNMMKPLVISPIAIQNKPIEDKWEFDLFEPTVMTMPADTNTSQRIGWINKHLTDEIDCVVLDYVGYPIKEALKLKYGVNKPLFELGQLAIATLKSVLD